MKIVWTWSTIPTAMSGPGQLSGNALWGSSPAVDIVSKIVYFGTGNNYFVPAALRSCYTTTAPVNWLTQCDNKIAPNNWAEAIIALNATSGKLIWGHRVKAFDAFTDACGVANNPNCPWTLAQSGQGDPDTDFNMEPVLSTVNGVKVLFIGQKSGVVYCLNAATGVIIWQTYIVMSSLGAISVDEKNIYVVVPNTNVLKWTLKSGAVTTGGGWAALDKKSGAIVWTTANPIVFPPNGAQSGPAASVGDIMLVGSFDGNVYSLSKSNGNILSSYQTGASVVDGFTADQTCAYVGNGHGSAKGKALMAFCKK